MREIYPWISDSARYPAWFCYAVRCLLSSGKFLFWTELYEGCFNSALGCLGWDGMDGFGLVCVSTKRIRETGVFGVQFGLRW